jgi:hypothetical protein
MPSRTSRRHPDNEGRGAAETRSPKDPSCAREQKPVAGKGLARTSCGARVHTKCAKAPRTLGLV